MSEPVFDANGWCHDIEHPEAREADEVMLWVTLRRRTIPVMTMGRWSMDENGWTTDLCEPYGYRPDVTAWRPLPPPPVSDS